MAAITKAAIKAIKFYKHVVQSVEKFIMKVSVLLICLVCLFALHLFKTHLCVHV